MTEENTRLNTLLESISDQPYQKIQKLRGQFIFPRFIFQFIRIQGSPGANPASIATVKILQKACEIPEHFFSTAIDRFALADFLIRRFNQGIKRFSQQNRGRDGSGSFHTIALSQKMMKRDSVLFNEKEIELRFIFSLPAKGSGGGKVDVEQTKLMFNQELAAIIDFTFYFKNYDEASSNLLHQYQEIQKTRQEIKQYMEQHGLIVFINNGACLPRQSGISDKSALGAEIKNFNHQKHVKLTYPCLEKKTFKAWQSNKE